LTDILTHQEQPQVIWYSPGLPHGPLIPDPIYFNSLLGLQAPQTPNFNELDISDKVSDVSLQDLLTQDNIHIINRRFRLRAEMSRSIVDAIYQISNALSNSRTIDGSIRPLYTIFVSDNGYLQGNHRFKKGKGQPYEESIRVPLFVTGPNITPAVSSALVQASDIAPTVGALCGAVVPETDAKSLVPLLSNPNLPWRNRVLIEHGWKGVRTLTRKYVEWINGEHEVYQLTTDPYELVNSGNTVTSLVTNMNSLLSCSGANCFLREAQ
jgi:hypothetical protein